MSVIPDLDKTMQRFLRKPVKVTLATLLGVYRAVMRLSSIAGALEDAFGDSQQGGIEAESGPVLLRTRIVVPLRQVSGRLSSLCLTRPSGCCVDRIVPACLKAEIHLQLKDDAKRMNSETGTLFIGRLFLVWLHNLRISRLSLTYPSSRASAKK